MNKKRKYYLISLITGLVILTSWFYYREPIAEPLPTKSGIGKVITAFPDQLNQKQLLPEITIALKKETQLMTIIEKMTLAEKIGQLFLARVPESKALADLTTYHLGGYLLFSRDIAEETPESLTKKIATFQKKAKFPLFIAADEEGGTVSRLSYEPGFLKQPFPSPQTLYNKDGLTSIKKDWRAKAETLHSLGISLPLAPVADVSTDPKAFIYSRTLGKDVRTTTNYIQEVVTLMAELQLGSTLKHFPGYGDNRDSHLEIVRDRRTKAELEADSLPPFKAGIKAGTDSILISHNIVEAYDKKHPASISPNVYQLLRDDLGFEGVIMTDDFDMLGLKEFTSQEAAAVTAIKSGADLILSSSYSQQIPAVIKSVEKKEITEGQIDQHVLRVLKLKEKLGLLSLD